MATTNDQREAIFNRLDELFSGSTDSGTNYTIDPETFEQRGQDQATGEQIATAKAISANTSDKGYRKLIAHGNVTSYSKLQLLHTCPRLFQLEMLKQNKELGAPKLAEPQMNIDFAFGHAVGAGIQTLAATNSLQAGQFAAFLAWKADYNADKKDRWDKSVGKNLDLAIYAVEKFWQFWNTDLSDWEVAILPNGKPAVELAFGVDTKNGYYHFGHIDTVLRSKSTGRLAVWEGKTTGTENVAEATYANSYQALGYSVVVDAVAATLGLNSPDYEVLYVVYSSKTREFQLLPFTKSRTQRAEWLQDLLLSHAMIDKYHELQFFPKRGDACINQYGRTCAWFGQCHMRTESLFPGLVPVKLEKVEHLESLDFMFTLDDLVAAQKQLSTSGN